MTDRQRRIAELMIAWEQDGRRTAVTARVVGEYWLRRKLRERNTPAATLEAMARAGLVRNVGMFQWTLTRAGRKAVQS